MREGKGTTNEEQGGGGELQGRKGAAANKTGAGARGARMAIAKVKNRRFPLSSDL
jgi:hypothetical protein